MNEIPDERLLLPDGLHLSATGVTKLIKNLKLAELLQCKTNHEENTAKCNESEKTNIATKKPGRQCTRSGKGVTVFFGKDSVYSNLHMATPITIDGQKFSCNEQYYTYCLAKFFRDETTAQKVMQTEDPYELVKMHKNVSNYDAHKWQPEADRTPYLANTAKYTQHMEARTTLLNTGKDEIGEASYSKRWGIGIPIQDRRALERRNWTGQNVMGNILMRIRDSFLRSSKKENYSFAKKDYYSFSKKDNNSFSMKDNYSMSKHGHYDESKSCWYCGEQNHVSKYCRHGQMLQCNTCYGYGHKAKFCYSY